MNEAIVSPQQEPQSPWSGKDVLLIVLGIAGVLLVAFAGIQLWSALSPAAGEGDINPSNALSAGLGALEGLALIGSVYWLGLRRRGLGWEAAGVRPASPQWLARGVWLGFAAIPLSALVALGVQVLLNRPVENVQLEFLAPEGFSWFAFLSMFLLGGVIVPFAEELFFRGVVYSWLRGRVGVRLAMTGSALVFGLAHGEVSVSAAAFVLGLLLAWVYERSSSLWPAVIIHMINNAFKIALLYALIATGTPLN